MPECPVCFGEGELDFRYTDAQIGEHIDPAKLEALVEAGLIAWPLGVVPCAECEGTGVVSAARLRDIEAGAVAAVDQAIAEHDRRERGPGASSRPG